MFVFLSRKDSPFVRVEGTLPPNAVCLVFDCLPSGYRHACEWILRNSNHEAVLGNQVYRLRIPLTREPDASDMLDLEDFELRYVDLRGDTDELFEPRTEMNRARYTGRLDAWPESTVFRLERIELNRRTLEIIDNAPANIRERNSLVHNMRKLREVGGCEGDMRAKRAKLEVPVTRMRGVQRPEVVDCIWPRFRSRGAFEDLWACGYIAEYRVLLPDVYTGLNQLQSFFLGQARRDTSLTTSELHARVMSRFGVAADDAWGAIEALGEGNAPLVDTGVLLRDEPPRITYHPELYPSGDIEQPLVPPVLLNGPLPLSLEVVGRGFREWIVSGQTLPQNAFAATPSAPGARFERAAGGWISVPRTEADPELQMERCFAPYGLRSAHFERLLRGAGVPFHTSRGRVVRHAILPNATSDAKAKVAVASPVRFATEFWDPRSGMVIGLASVREFVGIWSFRKLDALLGLRQELRARVQFRLNARDLLRSLWVQASFTDAGGCQKRIFFDESYGAKRARVAASYGEDVAERLLGLPISSLGAHVIGEESEEILARWEVASEACGEAGASRERFFGLDTQMSARDIWAAQLTEVLGTMQASA